MEDLSKKQFRSISKATYKTFTKACEKFNQNHNATIIDNKGNIIAFSVFKDISLGTFK